MNEEDIDFSFDEFMQASEMIDKYFELQEESPNHELLKFFEYNNPDNCHFTESLLEESFARFGDGFIFKKGTSKPIIEYNKKGIFAMIENYKNSLEKAAIDERIFRDWGLKV